MQKTFKIVLVAGMLFIVFGFQFAFSQIIDEDFFYRDAVLPTGEALSAARQTIPLFGPGSLPKPNIIFIITDDQPPNTIGISGNSIIKTPNIDVLGRQGVYFKNMYVTTGQCSPSRASILTGKLPHTTGVTTNGIILPTNHLTLSEILQANGYNTGFIGKCHLGDPWDPERYKRGFDFRLALYPSYGASDWYNYRVSRNGQIETRTEYLTDFLTTEAISFITSARQSGKPFFLWLAHNAPHLPTTPPHGSNRYTIDQIPTPVSITDDLSTKPPQQATSSPHQNFKRAGWERGKQRLKDAYEVMSNVDDNVGRIVSALEALGIKNDTIIVYLSDNGLLYGEHQMMQKGPTFYEEQIKTPFIFYYPKLINQGKTSDAIASAIDVMPTILDILKISAPPDVQGKSFLKVLTGEIPQYRSSVYLEYACQSADRAQCPNFPMRGIVIPGYKWNHYMASTINGVSFRPAHEFYDLGADPHEMNNLMKPISADDIPSIRMLSDPVYGSIFRKMRKERAVWQTDTKDPTRRIISNFRITALRPDAAELFWTTDAPTTAEIEYRESSCATCPFLELNSFAFATSHRPIISGLKPNTPYLARAFSIGRQGNGAYLETTFTTAPTSLQIPSPRITPSPLPSPSPSPLLSPTPTPPPREPEGPLNSLQVMAMPAEFRFTKPLYVGLRNQDVRYLQIFLKEQGSTIYPEALITGYYGQLTRQAVIRFQAKYGIPQVGIVGPLTRAKINELMK